MMKDVEMALEEKMDSLIIMMQLFIQKMKQLK